MQQSGEEGAAAAAQFGQLQVSSAPWYHNDVEERIAMLRRQHHAAAARWAPIGLAVADAVLIWPTRAALGFMLFFF